MEKRLMKKIKRKFPIGTLVQATIPRIGADPHVLLGLVISHVRKENLTEWEPRCEVFFGENPWMPIHTIAVRPTRLKSVSRTYTKGG